MRSLSSICRQYALQGPIYFLKIDVEGFERDVLLGADFGRYRPWIVVVEATRPLSQETSHDLWEDILVSAGYIFRYFDGLNRFYVREDLNVTSGMRFRFHRTSSIISFALEERTPRRHLRLASRLTRFPTFCHIPGGPSP